jgi:HAMP domain-containing protein
MRRLPIRLRVTGAFAVAMAAVLAGSGWFLYVRLDSHLALALDRELRLRSQDLAALVRQPAASLADDRGGRLIERGESYAQLIDPNGKVIDATRPLGAAALLDAAELRDAENGLLFTNRATIPGLDEPSRMLATPVSRPDRRVVLLVGATTGDNTETLNTFRDELLIAGPIALLLASLAGYFLAGLSLRQVELMRRRAAAVSADSPGERLPVAPTGDELERLGRTLNEMLARLEAALERERLRRRRRPRAAHAARSPANGARARAPIRRLTGGDAGGDSRLIAGGRPTDAARRRPPVDRPLRPRAGPTPDRDARSSRSTCLGRAPLPMARRVGATHPCLRDPTWRAARRRSSSPRAGACQLGRQRSAPRTG